MYTRSDLNMLNANGAPTLENTRTPHHSRPVRLYVVSHKCVPITDFIGTILTYLKPTYSLSKLWQNWRLKRIDVQQAYGIPQGNYGNV